MLGIGLVVMVLGLVGGLASCKTLARAFQPAPRQSGRLANRYAYYRKKTRGLALKRKRAEKKKRQQALCGRKKIADRGTALKNGLLQRLLSEITPTKVPRIGAIAKQAAGETQPRRKNGLHSRRPRRAAM